MSEKPERVSMVERTERRRDDLVAEPEVRGGCERPSMGGGAYWVVLDMFVVCAPVEQPLELWLSRPGRVVVNEAHCLLCGVDPYAL